MAEELQDPLCGIGLPLHVSGLWGGHFLGAPAEGVLMSHPGPRGLSCQLGLHKESLSPSSEGPLVLTRLPGHGSAWGQLETQ